MWSTIDSVASQAISLGIYIIIARLLSPQILGTVAACVLILELCKSVVLESFAIAVQARPMPTNEDYNAAFMLIVGCSTAIAIGMFFSGRLLEELFAIAGMAPIVKSFAAVLALQGMSRTHEAWLSRNQQFRSLAIRSIFSISLGGLVGIILALRGYGALALVGQQVAASLIAFIALWSVTPWRPGVKTSTSSVFVLLRYARAVALTGLTNFANGNSDIMFATWFDGGTGAGLYSLSKRLINAISNVIGNALNRVFFSSVAALQHDKEASARRLILFVTYTSLLTAPLFAGISILAPDIVQVLFGPKWQASGTLLATISITGFLTTIGLYNHSILLGFGKPQWQTLLTLIYAVSNVLIFLITARLGLEAIAIGYVVRGVLLYPLSAGAALYLVNLGFKNYVDALLPSLVACAVMAICILIAKPFLAGQHAIERIFVLAPFGMIVYPAAIFVMRRALVMEVWHILNIHSWRLSLISKPKPIVRSG